MTARPKDSGDFRLTVLNPGGRDPAQDFSIAICPPSDREHAPVNFHGYAACTGGSFERETKAAIQRARAVLLLLRGDFSASLRALRELKKAGLTIVISFKETGLHQIERQLKDPKRASRFTQILELADDCLAATQEALPFYGRGSFFPTPYPVDQPEWDFSRPLGERSGIFIGTREWDVPSRHHLSALGLALELGQPVTLFDQNPRRCRKLIAALGRSLEAVRFINRPLPYPEYLREMAGHKIILQADKSSVPGQVAGDAVLCRIPCVGGDGAIDRLAFPRTCGHGRSLSELKELAARLLTDNNFYRGIVDQSQELAMTHFSFEASRNELQRFFRTFAGN